MDLLTKFFKSTPTDKVTAAEAKKDEITKRYAKEQTDVDKEITDAEAEAKVQQVAQDVAVENKGTVVPVRPGADTNTNSNLFSAFPPEGSPKGGKSNKKNGGKSNKKKFSKKRKGGKRAKSQKKRR